MKYYDTYNSNYAAYDKDCTNFASQCLAAGNFSFKGSKGQLLSRMDSSWFYYGKDIPNRSTSWTGAEAFRKHFANANNGNGYEGLICIDYLQ